MTIDEIMEREVAEASARERARETAADSKWANRPSDDGGRLPWVAIMAVVLAGLTALAAAFAAGAAWQAHELRGHRNAEWRG